MYYLNNMYNTDFICTYKMMDTEEDCKLMYQIQLLQAFGINQMDEKIMNYEICNLFTKIKQCDIFMGIIDRYSKSEYISDIFKQFDSNKEGTKMHLFTILFQYDYFNLTHKSLCEFLNTGEILGSTAEEFNLCVGLH